MTTSVCSNLVQTASEPCFGSDHDRASQASGAVGLQLRLAELWASLVRGQLMIASSFFTERHGHFVVRRKTRSQSPGLPAHIVRILERVLLKADQKVVAAELGVAISTVANASRRGLEFMGLDIEPSRVPPLLVQAAHAAHHLEPVLLRPARFDLRESSSLFSATRPELHLVALLSPAELAVTRLVMEGVAHAEIARRRNTSMRTIANQICAVFRRTGVSGRAALIRHLVMQPVAAAAAPTRRSGSSGVGLG